jgi:hypothetical protein
VAGAAEAVAVVPAPLYAAVAARAAEVAVEAARPPAVAEQPHAPVAAEVEAAQTAWLPALAVAAVVAQRVSLPVSQAALAET